jgi:hypothetical protein
MKKIALMFLTRDELLNSDIWESFFDDKIFNVYIHPDADYSLKRFSDFQIPHLGHKKRAYNILASLELLKEAYKNNDNYKFVLLSEDCIPLTSNQDFYNYCIKDNLSNIRYGPTWLDRGHARFIDEVEKENQMANADWWMLNREIANCIIESEEDIINIYSKYVDNGEHAPSTIIHLQGKLNDNYVKNKDILYENYNFIFSGGDYSEFCDEQIDLIKKDLVMRGYFFLRKYKSRIKKYDSIVEHTHWEGIRGYE